MKNLTDEFHKAEGSFESKYELYKPMCKEVGAKYTSSIHLNDLPRCNENNTSDSSENKYQPGFDEDHFAFICNLTQTEYNGYVRTFVEGVLPEEFKPCFELIERNFPLRNQTQPDFCK